MVSVITHKEQRLIATITNSFFYELVEGSAIIKNGETYKVVCKEYVLISKMEGQSDAVARRRVVVERAND